MTKQDQATSMFKLVKEFEASGQSQKDFARAHGIKKGKLHYWICKSRNQKQKSSRSSSSSKKNFVPLLVPAVSEPTGQRILIRCSHGVEIEIPL